MSKKPKSLNRGEWELEQEKRKLLQDRMVTELKKDKFINEINNGLGEKIKNQPNTQYKKSSILTKIKKIIGWN
jgi:hypothetical protein